MNAKEYIEELKDIHKSILDYLDNEDNIEERYHNLNLNIKNYKIQSDQHKLKLFIYLLSKLSNNHSRYVNFISKIEKILLQFKENMKKNFTNFELFKIFKNNKRILLFLLEEEIIKMDDLIANKINRRDDYSNYFLPEILNYYYPTIDNDKKLQEEENVEDLKNKLPEDFYEKRKIGENDNEICQLIQKDLIAEFITYVKRNNIRSNSYIEPSIYETNNFLIKKKEITLIEYAAFFGSIQIFKYLKLNRAHISSNMWYYAIHGKDPEIISICEEKLYLIEKERKLKESIKCHHINVTNYIIDNYFSNEKECSNYILINSLKYYNFSFLENNNIDGSIINYLCKYNYYMLVSFLLKETNIDINKMYKQDVI